MLRLPVSIAALLAFITAYASLAMLLMR